MRNNSLKKEVYKTNSIFNESDEIDRLQSEYPFLKTIAEKEESIRKQEKLLGLI